MNLSLRYLFFLSINFLSTIAWSQFGFGSSGCGPSDSVVVDCKSHEIELSINGNITRSKIDCGRPGLTKNGVGQIGGLQPTTNVGDSVNIEGINGMGVPPYGSGEVFHITPPVGSNRQPSKANNSLGCIHVTQEILDTLKSCQGAKLEIKNATGGGNGHEPRPAPESSALSRGSVRRTTR